MSRKIKINSVVITINYYLLHHFALIRTFVQRSLYNKSLLKYFSTLYSFFFVSCLFAWLIILVSYLPTTGEMITNTKTCDIELMTYEMKLTICFIETVFLQRFQTIVFFSTFYQKQWILFSLSFEMLKQTKNKYNVFCVFIENVFFVNWWDGVVVVKIQYILFLIFWIFSFVQLEKSKEYEWFHLHFFYRSAFFSFSDIEIYCESINMGIAFN